MRSMARRCGAILVLGLMTGWSFIACSPALHESAIPGGDLALTGVFPGEASTLNEQLWVFDADRPIPAGPAIMEGTAYVGSFDSRLYAIDARTGEQLWTFDREHRVSIEHAPAASDGVVLFGSGGYLYAVDVETMEEMWRFEPERFGVDTKPAVADGTVYFGGMDGRLYAVEAETGEEAWAFDTGSRIRHSPALADDVVYVVNHEGTTFGVSAGSGEELWRAAPETEGRAAALGAPTVSGEMVYVPYHLGLYALDRRTGEVEWKIAEHTPQGSPVSAGDTLYYKHTGGSETVGLVALDASTGEELWSTTVTGEGSVVSPVLAGGILHVAALYQVHAIDARTGDAIGRVSVDEPIGSDPVLFRGTIYFSSGNTLQAVR